MKTLFILLLLTTRAFGFEMTLDVKDSSGRLQTVAVSAEDIDKNEFSPGMSMPHVIFPNGDLALIDSRSDLDEVICEELKGEYVFNPYRDLRMSFGQRLSYRRNLFSGTYAVKGNKTDGYYEEVISGSDLQIMTLGCTTY
jgi:hypothetical protein